MKLILSILIVAVGTASAQQCGCATPAPVNIQMSCGNAAPTSQPAPPPSNPQADNFEPVTEVSVDDFDSYPTEGNHHHDYDGTGDSGGDENLDDSNSGNTGDSPDLDLDYTAEEICHFEERGFPTTSPPGGFPCGFMVKDFNNNRRLSPNVPQGTPRPGFNWDGSFESLMNPYEGMETETWRGRPLPEKGTPLYNMLLCWPTASLTNCNEFSLACSIELEKHKQYGVQCPDDGSYNFEDFDEHYRK